MTSNLMRSIKIYETGIVKAASCMVPFDWAKSKLEKMYADRLSELRGIPLKISQILSMSNDQQKSDLFITSQSAVEPLELKIILDHLKNINPKLFAEMKHISAKCFPASMGQVHQIQLESGEEFALKILYPHIEECLKVDEKFISIVFSTFDKFRDGFALESYKKMIAEDIRNELDLRRELKLQQKIYQHFAKHSNIIIPNPNSSFSNKSCLVMSFEPSNSFHNSLKDLSLEQKYALSSAWSDYFFEMIFDLNLIHADPNAGNYGVRIEKDKAFLVVYDFGSVFHLKNEYSLILLKIFSDVMAGKSDILSLLTDLGFDSEILAPIEDQLLAFFDLLTEPFLSEGRYNLKTWNRKERAKHILGDNRWSFMFAAPPEILPLMRMIHGFFYYQSLLDVGIFTKKHIAKYIAKYQNEINLIKPIKNVRNIKIISQHLMISVLQNNEQKVNLKLPRKAIEQLDDFMEDELKVKLESQNINVEMIVNRARKSGYIAQMLFDLDLGEKRIKIYLE